jgi:hypothetical protein
MSNLAPILRALVMQARVNSQLIFSLGMLAKSSNLGPEFDKLLETLNETHDNNKELVKILDNAIDKMVEASDV